MVAFSNAWHLLSVLVKERPLNGSHPPLRGPPSPAERALLRIRLVNYVKMAANKNPPAGGISVSGIALILPAAHKCAFYWLVSRAIVTYTPLEAGLNPSLPPGGRWHSVSCDGRSPRDFLSST